MIVVLRCWPCDASINFDLRLRSFVGGHYCISVSDASVMAVCILVMILFVCAFRLAMICPLGSHCL